MGPYHALYVSLFLNIRTALHIAATGRPLGTPQFVVKLEGIIGRLPRPKPPGRKPMERPK